MSTATPPGPVLTLRRDDVLVFVDETGHDNFHDPDHPVFGWGGCIMTTREYAQVDKAWQELKRRHFPKTGVMHAAKLRLAKRRREALSTFFREQPFSRFGAVTHQSTPMDFDVVTAMATITAGRIDHVLKHLQFARLVFVYERADEWKAKVDLLFGEIQLPPDRLKTSIPKESGSAGLELSDFVCYAIGRAAKAHGRGDTARYDEELGRVFNTSNERQSFELPTYAIRSGPRPELPPGTTSMLVRSWGPPRKLPSDE